MRKVKVGTLWNPSLSKDLGKYGIYAKEAMARILQYERSRVDREGGCFSGVLFTPNGAGEKIKNLIEVLKNCTRLIDHLGWYDESSLCVLLTATEIEGAKLFAKKVAALLDAHYQNGNRPQYTFEVFRYPDEKHRKEIGNGAEEAGIYRNNKLRIDTHLIRRLSRNMPAWKRLLDIVGSLFGLAVLSPLLLLVALYIKVVSSGPVFYKSVRVGYKGRNFTFLKFRTMHADNDQGFHSQHATNFITRSDIPMEKLDEQDPRIIPGGRVLRKACIDELPQLINILRGQMSLVGPRPCIPYEAEKYLRWHAHRFNIVPGLTGLWQVSGKNKLTFREMIALDIAYSRKMSLRLDLKLIALTLPAILAMVGESVVRRLFGDQKVYD
ncbi:sugar transferase [Marispirochaeta sp.]|uniref:sugar transferase n=1 Tax=Marispirochaeta sp. TaxID=2038653 RepID=UPI0029C6B37A|nr:sugar transferase [Marispirochaeta sp.]